MLAKCLAARYWNVALMLFWKLNLHVSGVKTIVLVLLPVTACSSRLDCSIVLIVTITKYSQIAFSMMKANQDFLLRETDHVAMQEHQWSVLDRSKL
ncbi:hypothetical protein MRB53_041166 [Persea americana]|nr:hypothetical protein MRB53_041166 [Persea americana]